MTVLKEYSDGTIITKSRGNFDDWCIYINNKAPFDRDYFNELLSLASEYGNNKVFNDFKSLYDNTNDSLDQNIFDVLIPAISSTYNDRLRVEKLFGTLYTVMLAEENRFFGTTKTKLGKKVKGLAVYQILHEGMPVNIACNFSKGKNWRELDKLCNERNI